MAVIRLQAQYLLRATQRCEALTATERERLSAGLRRIDDAVTALGSALERIEDDDDRNQRSFTIRRPY